MNDAIQKKAERGGRFVAALAMLSCAMLASAEPVEVGNPGCPYSVSLAGRWRFALGDTANCTDTIMLPSTTDIAKKSDGRMDASAARTWRRLRLNATMGRHIPSHAPPDAALPLRGFRYVRAGCRDSFRMGRTPHRAFPRTYQGRRRLPRRKALRTQRYARRPRRH